MLIDGTPKGYFREKRGLSLRVRLSSVSFVIITSEAMSEKDIE